MTSERFALFETAIGFCAVVWVEEGESGSARAQVSRAAIVGTYLPETSRSALSQRVQRDHPHALESKPRGQARQVVEAMTRLLAKGRGSFNGVELELRHLPGFYRRVYARTREIPPGQTLSYGELAALVGAPKAARAVGQALGRNPFPVIVPCHRVLAKNGKLTGFSAPGGVSTKRRLLEIERAL